MPSKPGASQLHVLGTIRKPKQNLYYWAQFHGWCRTSMFCPRKCLDNSDTILGIVWLKESACVTGNIQCCEKYFFLPLISCIFLLLVTFNCLRLLKMLLNLVLEEGGSTRNPQIQIQQYINTILQQLQLSTHTYGRGTHLLTYMHIDPIVTRPHIIIIEIIE